MLAKCLRSLLAGGGGVPDEVVIVNAGAEDVRDVTKEYDGKFADIKIVPVPNISLTANRNAGILAAGGSLVAFTDDDCEVCPGWIDMFRGVFSSADEKIASAGGRVVDANSGFLAHGVDEVSMRISDHYDRKNSPYCYYFRTANVCYSRAALVDAGMFDENMKRTSADDLNVGLKLNLKGYKNVYCPESYVLHYGRSSLRQLARRLFSYGRDLYAVLQLFKATRVYNVFSVNRSAFYLVMTVFTGAVTDAMRLGRGLGAFRVFLCSFLMKLFVNSGVLYERSRKGK
jgi:GT2 family glycosyltransferase